MKLMTQCYDKKTDDIYAKLQKYVNERNNTSAYKKELEKIYSEIEKTCFLAQYCIENNIEIGQLSFSRKKDFFHRTNTKNSFGFFFKDNECKKILGIGYGNSKIFNPDIFKGYTAIIFQNNNYELFSNDENQITNLKKFKKDFIIFRKQFYSCLKEINL